MWRSDEELMLRYRDGDECAFEALYRRYEKPLLNFIYRMVLDATDAENLCQETFYRAVRGRRKYQATAQFKTWLFQIALNLCRDRLRRMKHRSHLSLNVLATSRDDEGVELQELIPDPASNPVKHVETDELEAIVKKAVASLPEDQRHVLILREYQGLKFSEIADIMEYPVGTVKSLNHTSFSVKALPRRSSSREATYRDQACGYKAPLTGFRYASLLNRRSLTEKLVLIIERMKSSELKERAKVSRSYG